MKKITLTSLVTFLIVLFSVATSYSQTSSVEEAICVGNCTAQDIKIVDVYLTDSSGNPIGTCDTGDTITVYLWVNLTSASKHNLYLQYNLLLDGVQQNSIGTKYTDKIYGAITSGAYHVSTITYTCGQSMELTDIYMSWTTPSGSEPACTDGPKCNGLTPDILVPTPIAANYTYKACNDGVNTTVIFTNTTTGGDTGSSYNYAWDFNDDGVTDSTAQNPTYTYVNQGPYEAELTVTQGIYSNSYDEYLAFPNELILTATVTQPTCEGGLGNVVLSATGGTGSYTYSGDATTNLNSGSYTYIVTDESGCTAPIDVTLNDATGPTATITGNEELTCENVTITLSASDSTVQGTAGYLWSTGETTETIETDTPGDYTVTVTDLSNNCTDSFTVTVTQDVLQPTAIIVGGPDIVFCENSYTILDASTSVVQGTASYLWSTGETTASIEVTTSNIYIVTVTDNDNGCSESVWVTVTAQLEPNAGDDGALTVCEGTTPSEAQLFAALTDADEGGTWSNLGLIYTYTVAATSPCTEEDTSIVTLTKQSAPIADSPSNVMACDSYILPVLNYGNYYSESGGLGVVLNAGDEITSTIILYVFTDAIAPCTIDAENSFKITINNSTTTATEVIVACDSYTWNGTAYTTSGVYTYESENEAGCTNTATLDLTINNSTTTEDEDIMTCSNFIWNGVEYTESGTYTFESENETGCTNTATLNLTISTPDEFDGDSIDLCVLDDIIDLTRLLGNDYVAGGTWTDDMNSGGIRGNIFDPSIVNLDDYEFAYTEPGDCGRIITVFVNVNDDCVVLPCSTEGSIEISKVVTANNDGANDYFTISDIASCGFTAEVSIFNRWGKIVYQSNNYQNNWSGYHNNSGLTMGASDKLPTGTYYYVINIMGSGYRPITGYIYLGTNK